VVGGISPANPPDWFVSLLGGGKTAAGIEVNQDLALNLSGVWCAVNILSNSLKILPLHVHRWLENGGSEKATNHPVYRLLYRRPNPEMPSSRLRGWMQACKLLWGNGYAEIERARNGTPLNLWPIHPSRVRVMRDSQTQQIVYEIHNNVGANTYIDAQNMFHLVGFTTDGIVGRSVIAHARESMGLSLAAEKFGAQFFGNGATTCGVLQRPREAPPMDDNAIRNLRLSWLEHHSGDNRHLPAVLQEGTEWKPISMPNDDAQFLETRQFQVLEIARWFDLPPHKLKHLADATFSNIEHEQMSFLRDSLSPHLVDFQDECNRKLFADDEQDEYYAKFNVRALLWADHTSRATYYNQLWQIGVYSPNDIRELEDMNPLGPEGDRHFIQLNMTTLDDMTAGAAVETDEPDKPETTDEQILGELMNAYGIAVRSGAITPQPDDERAFRLRMGLPPPSSDVDSAWSKDGGTRRPVTLKDKAETGDGGNRDGDTENPNDADDTDSADSDSDKTDQDNREEAKRIMMPVFVDAIGRIIRKEVNAIRRYASRAVIERSEKLYRELGSDLVEAVTPAAEALCAMAGIVLNPSLLAGFAEQHVVSSRSELAASEDVPALLVRWINQRAPAEAAALADLIVVGGTAVVAVVPVEPDASTTTETETL